jgi:Leucine-rich repeat (LRR) protein
MSPIIKSGDLFFNLIYREIPSRIEEIDALQVFKAFNNKIQTIPEQLFLLPEILYIDLSNNDISV